MKGNSFFGHPPLFTFFALQAFLVVKFSASLLALPLFPKPKAGFDVKHLYSLSPAYILSSLYSWLSISLYLEMESS